MAVPVVAVETTLLVLGGVDIEQIMESGGSTGQVLYISFVVAGITEEVAKYVMVSVTVSRSPYLRQSLDGLVFAAAVALGFASIENVGYMGASKQYKLPFGSTFAAVAAAAILHGLFNFLLFSEYGLGWVVLEFLVLIGLFVALVRLARRKSPYRHKVAAVWVTCSGCLQPNYYPARFCVACGRSLAIPKTRGSQQCSKCNATVASQAQFCTECGSRLDRKLVSAPDAGLAASS